RRSPQAIYNNHEGAAVTAPRGDMNRERQGSKGRSAPTAAGNVVMLREGGATSRDARWHEVVRQREQAREEERRRVARELHDELGHALFSIKTDTAWVRQRLTQSECPQPEVEQKIAVILEVIEQTIKTVNGIVTDLRPAALDQLGLLAALE